MKRQVWIGLLIIACAGGFSGCGGDDDDGGDSEAGTGGSRAGTGGSRAGTGGTGGSGTSGTSGGSGSGAAGTGTMNPAGCPGSAPMQDAACTMEGITCAYEMMECDCDPAGMGGSELAWDCNPTGGGEMQMCPATEPTNGGTCTPGRGDCEFGARICDCVRDSETWACWDPADCPTMPPAEGSTCPLIGMECDYDGGGQRQGGGNCDCEDTGWDCGGDFQGEDAGI